MIASNSKTQSTQKPKGSYQVYYSPQFEYASSLSGQPLIEAMILPPPEPQNFETAINVILDLHNRFKEQGVKKTTYFLLKPDTTVEKFVSSFKDGEWNLRKHALAEHEFLNLVRYMSNRPSV